MKSPREEETQKSLDDLRAEAFPHLAAFRPEQGSAS